MLARATVRLGERAQLHLVDGRRLPFADGRFDLVMATMMLHEVPDVERRETVAEMARVVRPQGRMAVTDYRFGSLRGWQGPSLRALTWAVERVAGHYRGYRSFREAGGVPEIVRGLDLVVEREKILAGGNVALYVIVPQP
jgi:ubiquinone/menaquinone biosynthesis C-methylase UbiE